MPFALGERLRAIREQRERDQKDISPLVGITRERLSMYETNARSPRVMELEAILSAYGTTIQEFFECRVPPKLSKAHIDIHEKLETILAEGDQQLCATITGAIDLAYSALPKRRRMKEK